jgi:uncharacterized Zn finger protein
VSRPCPGCGAAEARPFAEKNAHRIVRCGRCATLYTKRIDAAYALNAAINRVLSALRLGDSLKISARRAS